MVVLRDIFNDPLNFFKKKRDFKTGFAYMLFSLLVFVLLNQLMVEIGFVNYERQTGVIETIIINYLTMIGGYFVITAICFLPYKYIGGKDPKDLFKVAAYALIPIIFLWIPHIIPQAIIVGLGIILMTRGVSIYSKATNKKAFAVTLCFIILIVALSVLVRNFILLFGSFYV